MATQRLRYVDTASSGGNGTTTALSGANAAYASLQAALNAERADLVTADVYLSIRCAASGGAADTTAVDQNAAGWTTDATRYVDIGPQSGHEARTAWDTNRYRHSYGASGTFSNLRLHQSTGGIAYIRIWGLQIESDWASLNAASRYVTTIEWVAATGTGGGNVRIYNNHIRWVGTNERTYTNASQMIGLIPSTSGASPEPTLYAWNNILSNETTVTAHNASTCFVLAENRNHAFYGWNNTLRGALPYGFRGDNGTDRLHYLKNNLIAGVTTAATEGGDDSARSDYNATTSSDIGYTAGSHDRVSQTFTFVSTTDHALASSDTGAKDYGVADPGSGLFSDDINGTTRSAPWDIGAFECMADDTGFPEPLPPAFGVFRRVRGRAG